MNLYNNTVSLSGFAVYSAPLFTQMTHMSAFETILSRQPATGVQLIMLNRPQAYNALNNQMLAEIASAIEMAAADDAIRCVVISGSEKVFAAGADVREMAALDQQGIRNDPRSGYWKQLQDFDKPMIAAVNGYALGGGCELAMHCDIIIAGRNAQFGQPEINLGIIPGAGGTQRLIRSVGKSLASQMILSGEFIDARRARDAGLVSEICQPELTLQHAISLAQRIAQKAPLALAAAKKLLNLAFENSLSDALEKERESFIELAGSADRNEGINAFLEKRKAHFSGK